MDSIDEGDPRMANLFVKTPYSHGIVCTHPQIINIIAAVLPGRELLQIDNLIDDDEIHKNRIFFLTVHPPIDRSPEGVVLKVLGHLVPRQKIQNEVANLCLLEHLCLQIPAPRVLGWSVSGREDDAICRLVRSQSSIFHEVVPTRSKVMSDFSSERGWILLTRRPGRSACHFDLEGEYGEVILKEMARITANIRRSLPSPRQVGNMRIIQKTTAVPLSAIFKSSIPNPFKVQVNGLLRGRVLESGATLFMDGFYFDRLLRRVRELSGLFHVVNPSIVQLQQIAQDFLDDPASKTLLRLVPESDQSTFTMIDLVPGNFLISNDKPPSVTGVVNFDLAGFFPPEFEFANLELCNASQWPSASYHIFLTELEQLGVSTPLQGLFGQKFDISKLLMKLTGYLYDLDPRQQQIEPLIGKAVDCIEQLKEMVRK